MVLLNTSGWMLFRNRKGVFIEVNILDFSNDKEYYQYILKLKEYSHMPKDSSKYINDLVGTIHSLK